MRKVTAITQLKKAWEKLEEARLLLWKAREKRIDYYNEKTENWRYQDRGCDYFDTTELVEDYRTQLTSLMSDLDGFIDSV